MSTLARRYSSYLTSTYNYKEIIIDWSYFFNDINEKIEIVLNNDTTNSLNKYPIYETSSKTIYSLLNYNLMKIYNISPDDINHLLDSINKQNVLTLKHTTDKSPILKDNYILDYHLQMTYHTDLDELYNERENFNPKTEKNRRVFYPKLFNPSYNTYLEEGSYIQQLTIQSLFTQTYINSVDFMSKSTFYFSENDIINKTEIQDEFTSYINRNLFVMSEDITSLTLKTVYQFPNVSENLKQLVAKEIEPEIEKLKDLFNTFTDLTLNDPIFDMCQLYNKALSNIISTEVLKDTFHNGMYFDQYLVERDLILFEDDLMKTYLDNITSSNIKEYFYLLYLYKFWPFKFLNVIPYVLRDYVEHFLKPEEENSILPQQFKSYLKQIKSTTNFTNLSMYLNSHVNNTYLNTIEETFNVSHFVSTIFFIKHFDRFFNLKDYDTIIHDILNKIYITLRDNGHISEDQDWYFNNKVINIYLKSLFRADICDNKMLNNLFDNFTEHISLLLRNNTHDSKYNITCNFSDYKIEKSFDNIISYSDNLNLTFENHVTSSLICELTFNYTSYFLNNFSGRTPEGIGYWYLERDFEVQ